ncbi:hypothetical protein GM921_17185 [Pedobacter sp. LMG 31464]|uniref:Uncharacterized protein n=1 Tax=Pedobacter planticolens TaxID=2679964 RepID=A0A923IWT1_9SPHI|nr:hypothetical protein [Pedobacter planticolens]MBB2147238.1 hypothetical protein [Pedobacter planticolens]
MKSILTLKHWQIFLILVVGSLMYNFTIEGDQLTTMIIRIIGAIIYSLWPILTGNELYQLLPKRVTVNFNFFLFNIFISLLVFVSILILSYGEGMTFSGIYAIPMFYVFFAILYCLAFPAKLLNCIETGKEVSMGQYLGDFFLVLFLPIGIWFLQPRINKVVANERLARLEAENDKAKF